MRPSAGGTSSAAKNPLLIGIGKDGEPEGYAVDAQRALFYTNLEDRDRTLAIDVQEPDADAALAVVEEVLSSDLRTAARFTVVDIDEEDPSLYCTSCNAKRSKDCVCGPIAENH